MIVADGRIIDSTKWNFWEWPQSIGLNGLLDVCSLPNDELKEVLHPHIYHQSR